LHYRRINSDCELLRQIDYNDSSFARSHIAGQRLNPSPLIPATSHRSLSERLLVGWRRQPLLASLALLLIFIGLLAGLFTGSDAETANNTAENTAPLLSDGSYLHNPPPDSVSDSSTKKLTSKSASDDTQSTLNAGDVPNRDTANSNNPQHDSEAAATEQQPTASPQDQLAHATPPTVGLRWEPVQVSSGDTMEKIFRNRSLSPSLLHEIVSHDDNTRALTRLKSGELLDFAWHDDGSLAALKRAHDDEAWLIIERQPNGDIASHLQSREIETRIVETAEVINSNLFIAGQRAGMSDALIMRMAGIFAWDIDFALDIRQGDRFGLIYEQIWRDGEYLRDGDIVAARFTNQGDQFTALRFEVDGQVAYYNPEGRPMRKAFLRAPLNFTRVTSNFNPRRYHPVLKRVRPHNGTDYGAATGTPVYAAGDGTVIASAYNNANGNYVFVRHRNEVVTKYLHFSKRLVKRGDRVRQGQVIGHVGSTGLASGPHLHYEFLVNGVHRNPRTVDLPEDPPLSADMVAKLQQQHGHLVPQLARIDNELTTRLLAKSDGRSRDPGEQTDSTSVIGPGPQ
jgi:murein DD-endopeptidase MepM/ murein hydrolase activator NlpD